ncbi:methionine--tRNA ligase [Candidatus Roizmanbacteria bacterium]|nr:methionine--tRNA ligase [Candidatus Roizmanbacteria bacterium]
MNTTITFEDFQKLDIRIGTIVSVSEPEGSEKILRLEVDLGEEIGKRIVFAGIKKFYKPEELLNRQIVVLVNLASRKFFGEDSGGMLLAADEEGKPTLLILEKNVTKGSKVR